MLLLLLLLLLFLQESPTASFYLFFQDCSFGVDTQLISGFTPEDILLY